MILNNFRSMISHQEKPSKMFELLVIILSKEQSKTNSYKANPKNSTKHPNVIQNFRYYFRK